MCRREGIKLHFKGWRCETAKCPMEREGHDRPPGMFPWRRARMSDFAVRLREKQKVKRYYGVLEKQFRRYFAQAERLRGNTGEELLTLLERRLDNVVYKLNFMPSRRAAREFVTHGNIFVNGKKVDIPSYQTCQGDKITVRPKDKLVNLVKSNVEGKGGAVQHWLQLDPAGPTGTVVALPSRDDVQIPVQEHFIIEISSR
jgi:small subunit ribosomal protein S4